MNGSDMRNASTPGRTRRLMLMAGALLIVLVGGFRACQGRSEQRSEPARILYDSLLAANEGMYSSANPNLGYDRIGCLEVRARPRLGDELLERLSAQAAREVRSRHTQTEWAAVNQGLAGDHPYSTPEFCQGIDSLWYARLAARPKAPPRP